MADPHQADPFADPAALARRIEHANGAGIASAAATWAEADPGCDFITTQVGAAWIIAGDGPSPLARTVGLGLDGPVEPDVLDAVESLFRERAQAPRIDVAHYADAGLLATLIERGYRPQTQLSVLARQVWPGETIDRRDRSGPGHVYEPMSVARLSEADQAETDAAVDAMGRAFEDEPSASLIRATRQGIAEPATTTFVARVSGEIVGGAFLAVRDQIASFFGAGVLPAYRRRGIHTALITGRLMWARDSGARLAAIQGPPGGPTERNARRAGFHLAYTKVVMIGRPAE